MDNKDLRYFNEKKSQYEYIVIMGGVLVGISFVLWIPMGVIFPIAMPLLMIMFVGGGIIAGIGLQKFKKLSNEFKSIYLAKEIQKIYPGCTYEVNKGFDKEEIYRSKILPREDRYYSEDLITGEYEGVSFQTADVKLQDVRRDDDGNSTITVFFGRVYKFAFNKRFKSNIIINQPNLLRDLFDWKRIKTESIKFNSELSVYSDNEHEAFYILTPHFMEKIYQLDKKYKDKITFSFKDNYLYIAIDNRKDTFDIKIFRKLDFNIIDEYREQLNDIKEFIHHLNLNKDLFIDKKSNI